MIVGRKSTGGIASYTCEKVREELKTDWKHRYEGDYSTRLDDLKWRPYTSHKTGERLGNAIHIKMKNPACDIMVFRSFTDGIPNYEVFPMYVLESDPKYNSEVTCHIADLIDMHHQSQTEIMQNNKDMKNVGLYSTGLKSLLLLLDECIWNRYSHVDRVVDERKNKQAALQ